MSLKKGGRSHFSANVGRKDDLGAVVGRDEGLCTIRTLNFQRYYIARQETIDTCRKQKDNIFLSFKQSRICET